MIERTHFVYEAYDADGLLLYVGCTGNPATRHRAHMQGDPGGARGWFHPFVTDWRVSGPYPKTTALRIERERIAERQPIWNGQSYENQKGRRAAIAEYLKFHGVEFVEHPRYINRAMLVEAPRRRGRVRRLRVVA